MTAFAAEVFTLRCRLAMMLTDRALRSETLIGGVSVAIAGQYPPKRKPLSGTWVFTELPPGSYDVEVRSAEGYYFDATIPVVVPGPDALWPAYPDLSLADLARKLDDPLQPAAYRAQRELAALRPATRYPFPAGFTLVRGTVRAGGAPLAEATVSHPGGEEIAYRTGADGEYVLFFEKPGGMEEVVVLRASHIAKPDVDVAVPIRRGSTSALDFDMAP